MVSKVLHLLLLHGHINCDIRRSESRAFNKAKIGITDTTKNTLVWPYSNKIYCRKTRVLTETETHPASFLARYKKGFSKL